MHPDREATLRKTLGQIATEIAKAETLLLDPISQKEMSQLTELAALLRLQQTRIKAELAGGEIPTDPRD